tara:strand:- start:729 stop:1964 length:1236 start_codon:yes stop_codon:yes gene_type:complete
MVKSLFFNKEVFSLRKEHTEIPNDWDRSGLPAWSFFNNEMFEAEKDLLFRRHWQLICHSNDIPNAGDFITWNLIGERALVIRGKDQKIRAFHNLCKHRGSRVIAHDAGTCKSTITCPFHGWTYNLDGTLRGASQPSSLPKLDPVEYGLPPLEMDIWNGFIFVRFQPGPQPALSDILKNFDIEVSQYELYDLEPTGDGFWTEEIDANWKCVRDVDNEGYHVPMAHPGLHDLFGKNYYDEPIAGGLSRSVGSFDSGDGRLWSVRNYKKLLHAKDSLDETHQKCWLYIGVFPNLVFGLYPDSVIFYQEYPVKNGKTIQRGGNYKYAEESREMKVSRYLSMRIDRLTSKEDEQLIKWSWEAAFSSAYEGVLLSDLEYGVKAYHDTLREYFPVLLGPEPERGRLLQTNERLLAKRE